MQPENKGHFTTLKEGKTSIGNHGCLKETGAQEVGRGDGGKEVGRAKWRKGHAIGAAELSRLVGMKWNYIADKERWALSSTILALSGLAGMICNYIADDERRALLSTIIALSRVVEVTGAGIISWCQWPWHGHDGIIV